MVVGAHKRAQGMHSAEVIDVIATPARVREDFFHIERTHRGRGAPIPGGETERWILCEGPRIDSEVEFFNELCWRLLGDGIPLWRANLHIGTLHPQTRGFGLRWWRERKVIEEYRVLHGAEMTDDYLHSPIRASIERGTRFRRRLDQDTSEYPLLTRIRQAGGTDYLALALNPVSRRFPVAAWATDRPGGFGPADIAVLEAINPALAAIVETRAVRHIRDNLLDTYLGPHAARRVLGGQIRRGQGERMRVVIMASDLRGFTGLSDRLPPEEMIELLDEYFETISSSVRAHGGEILKFAGDGVLAIFMADDGPKFGPAALCALEGATEALERFETINRTRRERGQIGVRTGIGLHFGDVTYGNVGATDRLDFTVIGPAVNLAFRIEGLTKRLPRPLLTSRAFAEICPRPLVSYGPQPIRGLHQPEEVFGLPTNSSTAFGGDRSGASAARLCRR
jgi:adenylate cyclase